MFRRPSRLVALTALSGLIQLAVFREAIVQAAGAPAAHLPGADAASAASANLVLNGSNEAALAGGEIPGWDEVVGTQWSQAGDASYSQDGDYHFWAGNVANGELKQDIDVSAHAALIDAGLQSFSFGGWVRSVPQNPPDSTRIKVEYRHLVDVPLYTYDSGEIQNPGNWMQLADSHAAPIGTRTIRIRLIAKRYVGTSNDGYFDNITLVADDPQAFVDLGSGLPGSSGVPTLAGNGTLAAGSSGSLDLSGAAPLAFTNLFVSLSNTPTPFKGGTLSTVPVALQLPVGTFLTGSWTMPWSNWPAGIPTGFQWYFQVAVVDAAAPEGVAISNLLGATQP